MFEFDWMNLLQTLGGFVFGGGIVAFTKAGRAKTKAEAMKAMSDAYEYRIESLHKVIENHNKSEIESSQRIADLNRALNDKEDEIQDKKMQIRNLTEKVWESEQEVNRVQGLLNDEKDLQLELTKEHLRKENALELELARKKCEDIHCPFRQPPTADTPPMPDMTKEEYHAQKLIELKKN